MRLRVLLTALVAVVLALALAPAASAEETRGSLARRSDGDRGIGHVMLSLRHARDTPAFDATLLEHLFGLSPTQAGIALALFNGRSPEEIALERGIKMTTLRTHLTEIFLRTGTETQRDLMRLLGTLPPLCKRDAAAIHRNRHAMRSSA